jgi:hypothetical protein
MLAKGTPYSDPLRCKKMALAIKQTRVVTVPVTELRAALDMACVATILDAEGVVVGQSTAPSWLPQVLQIDLESGRIVNWRAPTGDQLQAMADATSADTCIDDMGIANFQKECQRISSLAEVADEQNSPEITQPIDTATPVQAVAVETAPEGQQHNSVIDIELPADFAVESVVARPVVVVTAYEVVA